MSTALIDYDAILDHIGQCGHWQLRLFFLLSWASLVGGMSIVIWAFTGYPMKTRCPVPLCEEDPALYSNNGTFPNYVAIALPGDIMDNCKFYEADPSSGTCQEYLDYLQENADQLTPQHCALESLIFDKSVVHSSVVSHLGMVCDRAFVRDYVGATFMLGLLVGSFTLGLFADRYGRMKGFVVSALLLSVCGTLGAFAPDYYSFGLLRFLSGMGGQGCFMLAFILSVEFVGAAYTTFFGVALMIPFTIGCIIFSLEAMVIRDWLTLHLVVHVPMLALFLLWFVIPESPRWLIAIGRSDEAIKIIGHGARANGKNLPEKLLQPMVNPNGSPEQVISDKMPSEDVLAEEVQLNMLDLFKTRLIMLRTLNMSYQWFTATLCYYGLSFISTGLSGDAHMNLFLIFIIEVPGNIFCLIFMDYWGRRCILSFSQTLSGLACITAGYLSAFDEVTILPTVLAMIGKFGATCCFSTVYVYTAELFPTALRNTAVGICSTLGKVGGIIALLILMAKPPWPMVVMGSMSMISGLLALLFPETVGRSLPQTMGEAVMATTVTGGL